MRTEETYTIGYAMVGFKVSQILYAVRDLAEEVGLFQWDIIARGGQVIYRKEKKEMDEMYLKLTKQSS